MSNTKAFIDYSMQDNGAAAREALYAEIHDRVMAHIEQKKMELAGGMLHTEAKSCEYDDMKEKMEKAEKKVKKLKEQLSLIEAAMCDGDNDADDKEYKDKKKKLKKAKKKLKKLKESLSLTESGEIDEDGEWEGEPEQTEESEESSDEESCILGSHLLCPFFLLVEQTPSQFRIA